MAEKEIDIDYNFNGNRVTNLPDPIDDSDVITAGYMSVWVAQQIDAATLSGPQGEQGAKGDQGDAGPTGPKGDTGLQGIKGNTGDAGPKGDQGIQGLKGDTGSQGLKGDKGDIGLTGPAPDTSAFVTTTTTQAISGRKDFTDSRVGNPVVEASAVSRSFVNSRGDNLFINGSGGMVNNYNMSGFTFSRQTHGGAGSFLINVSQQSRINDDLIPVDPSKAYRLSLWARSGDDDGSNFAANNRQYFGIAAYDGDNNVMDYIHRTDQPGTGAMTTLVNDLVAGDTTFTVADGSAWYIAGSATSRHFVWWPYVSAAGINFAPGTYSRNVSYLRLASYGTNGTYTSRVGNVFTLSAPWVGATVPAGSPIANRGAGGTYIYAALSNGIVPNTWTNYSATFFGQNSQRSSTRDGMQLPFGCASIRLLVLVNYHGAANNNLRVSDISVTEHGSLAESADSRYTKVAFGGTLYMLSTPLTSGHLLGMDEGTIYLDQTPGSRTVVLPDPTVGPLNPVRWTFVRTDATANTLIFSATNGKLVNGVASLTGHMTTQGSSRTFSHDGTQWWLVGGIGS